MTGHFSTINDLGLQNIVVVLSFLPIAYIYWKEAEIKKSILFKPDNHVNKVLIDNFALRLIVILILAILLGIAWNNIILLFPEAVNSKSYQEVNASLMGKNNLIFTLLRTCILAPVTEEILYRGIVFRRLRKEYTVFISILFSSLLFGIIHFNMVQFLYALVLGILFAYIYEREQNLLFPVLCHAGINFVAILREKSDIFKFWEKSIGYAATSIVLLVISSIIIMYIYNGRKNRKNIDTI